MVLRASLLVILIGASSTAAAADAPAAAPAPPATSAAQHLIAVVEVTTDGSVRIPGKLQLVDLVRQQVRGHAGYEAVTKEEVKAAIASHDKVHAGCVQDRECLGAVARDLNAEAVLAGTLTGSPGAYAVMLWIVDGKPAPTRIASGRVANMNALWPQIQTSLDKLYSWGAPDPALMSRPEQKPVVKPKEKPAPPAPVVVAKPPEPAPAPAAAPPPPVAKQEAPPTFAPAPAPPPREEPKPPPVVAKREEPKPAPAAPPPPPVKHEEPAPPSVVARQDEPKPAPQAPPPAPAVVKQEEPKAGEAVPPTPPAAPAPGGEASDALSAAELQAQLLRRVKYDSDYFQGVQAYADAGKTNPKLPPEEFAKDVARAKTALPTLKVFVSEQDKYAAGQPFSLPPPGESSHVYTNVFSMLNSLQAYERGDFTAAVDAGSRVVARPHDRIGFARGAGTSYSPNIYRDFATLLDDARRRAGGAAAPGAAVVPAPPVAIAEPPAAPPPPAVKQEAPPAPPPAVVKQEPPPAPSPVVAKQEAPPAPPPAVAKTEPAPAAPAPAAVAKEQPAPPSDMPLPPLPPADAKDQPKMPPVTTAATEAPKPPRKDTSDLPPLPPIETIAPDRFEQPPASATRPPSAEAPTAAPPGVPGTMAAAEIAAQLLKRVKYDADYFRGVEEFSAAGKAPEKLPPAEFAKDVARARTVLPVLTQFLGEQERYAGGEPFTLPPANNNFRVYTNVFSMLNALQAYQRGQFAAAVEAGAAVVAKKNERIGLARGAGSSYSPNLYRDFFVLMADAHQRVVDAAAAPPPAPAAAADTKAHPKPIAILPFATAGGGKPDAWMKSGLPEVIAGDLIDHTDIPVVDRVEVEQLASSNSPQDVGKATQAGTVIVGSAIADHDRWSVYVQVVDVKSGQTRASATGLAVSERVVLTTRELVVKALTNAALLSEDAAAEISAARPPSLQSVKDLGFARVMLGNKVGDAEGKRLFAAATHSDPAYANLFGDLKARYPDVHATIAVAPFALSGTPSDAWMAVGVDHILSSAFVGAGFDLVDRARFRSAIPHAPGDIFTPDDAKVTGQKVHADVVIVGDLTHQTPNVRLAARAVDVKSGEVLFSAFTVDTHDDLPAAAAALALDLARHLNAPLSDKVGADLATGLPPRAELEARARQDAVESAIYAATHATTVRPLPWVGVSFTIAGAAAATALLVVSSQRLGYASYYAAQANDSPTTARRAQFNAESASQLQTGTGLEIAGFVSLAVAASGIGMITFDLVNGQPHVAGPPRLGATQTPTPSLTENSNGSTTP
jgi:TolB-like protein